MLFYLFPLETDALDDELEDDPLLTLDDGLELELDLEIEEDPDELEEDLDMLKLLLDVLLPLISGLE